MMIPMSLLPYARAEGGLASVFHKHQTSMHALLAWVFLVLAGLFVQKSGAAFASIIVIIVAHGLAIYIRKKIGGMTGDTLGAVCEICELLPALTLLLWNMATGS